MSSISKLDDCINNKTLSDEINIEATKVLIDTLSKYNVKVIYFSSEFVFDGTKGNYSENDATNPINVYGNQKLAIENYIQRNTSNYCILRIAKTYSSSFNDRSLLANWYDCIVKKNISEIKCFADQAFSPLYVNDLCLILNSIIDINLIGIINVGGPSKHTRLDCLRYFLRAFGWGDRVNVIETTLSTIESNDNWPKDVSFNVSKLNNIFTFNLTSIEYVCRKMKERHEKIIRAS